VGGDISVSIEFESKKALELTKVSQIVQNHSFYHTNSTSSTNGQPQKHRDQKLSFQPQQDVLASVRTVSKVLDTVPLCVGSVRVSHSFSAQSSALHRTKIRPKLRAE